MKNELLEKLIDFGSMVLTIVLDGLLVIIYATIATIVNVVLEKWVLYCRLEEIDNVAVLAIYNISKVFLICIFLLYVAWDLVSQCLNVINRFKNKNQKSK